MADDGDKGGQGAFARVVAEYESRLLRYVARLTGNASSAEDIVQETLVRLARSWHDALEPSPQLQGWLYRVAHNEAIDHLRRESRLRILHRRHAEEQGEMFARDHARDDVDPDSGRAAAAEKALQCLSDRERELVTLKVYERKSYKEISAITGLTVGNVGYILHNAMKKLAAILARGEDESK